jgi:Ca2+-transporting ATPase
MITGDNAATALAIARSIGVVGPGEGPEGRVYARVTPEQKLEIVRELKRRGEIVAMTGDGVNDAPALREAHVGIAMGRTGAEATREVADLVLTDDNFASIVGAVREGRAIWDNIHKTVIYLLTGNTGELLLMLAAAIGGLPAPLLPLHLLWINLVTDGLPALALVADPASAEVLSRPPRAPQAPLLDRSAWLRIGGVGAIEAAVSLAGFLGARAAWGLDAARNLAFSTLVFSEVLRALAARDRRRVFWETGASTNPRLVAVVVLSCLAQVGVLAFPPARAIFRLGRLPWGGVALAFGLGMVAVTLVELAKLILRAWPERGTKHGIADEGRGVAPR